MSKAKTSGTSSCTSCGAKVGAGQYLLDQERVMCESCNLEKSGHIPVWAMHEQPYIALSEALATALDEREHETGMHSKRVACHTMVLAKRFSSDEMLLRQVYWGALLHDIGKIGIPDSILLKHDSLTQDEWKIMRQHPELGRNILARVPHLAQASEIVFCHEERFDGSGYPQGLAGEAIPLWARLFAVIDTLDAITSDRPYRKGLSFDTAKAEILRMSNTQFDPQAVEAFSADESVLRKMVELKCVIPMPGVKEAKWP